MKVNADERGCVCRPATSEQCQCQYSDWPSVQNRHQACDFCGENPVVLSVNDDAWWICAACAQAVYGGEEE